MRPHATRLNSGDPWAPHVPDADAPWDLRRVVHLHRRAGFAAPWDEHQRDLAAGPTAAVGRLLEGTADAHAPVSPNLHEIDAWGEHARTAKIMLILFQVAAILASAKLLGWLAEKVKVPGVIGELLAAQPAAVPSV